MPDQSTAKRCTGCGQVKPLEEFHRHPRGLGERKNQCKTCVAAYARTYRQANLERLRAYDAARYSNPGRSYATSSEAERAQYREARKRWRRANPEKVKESARRQREVNRDANREYNRQYRLATLKTRQERDRERYWALKRAVLQHYGTTCACCGTAERLSIDHINGDGGRHRRELFGHNVGGDMYRWLTSQNFPPGFQILCLSCNQSKKNGDRCRLEH